MLKRKNSFLSNAFKKGKIGIIVGLFNEEMTWNLLNACTEHLKKYGYTVPAKDIFFVPGAFEIPLKAQKIAPKYDVIIALGVIIKGDTYHFELIANECARGVMNVILQTGKPIIFEVLACFNKKDALIRSGSNHYNKGIEAAEAALQILSTL